jgi:hypothetical protein
MISIVTAISIEKPRFDARFSPPFRISSGSVKIQAISQFLVVKIHDLTIINDLISTIIEHHPLGFPIFTQNPKEQQKRLAVLIRLRGLGAATGAFTPRI